MIDPEKWVENYADYLYRYARSRTCDPATAEDLVQETFLAGIRGLSTFDNRLDIKYWLRGILRNKVVDHIRKQVRLHYTDDLQKFDEPPTNLRKYFGIASRKIQNWSFNPAEQYECKEFWKVFGDCLDKVKEPLRSIYVMKEIENESNERICKDFDITPNNLWVITHRARSQLKTCLNRNWTDDRAD